MRSTVWRYSIKHKCAGDNEIASLAARFREFNRWGVALMCKNRNKFIVGNKE